MVHDSKSAEDAMEMRTQSDWLRLMLQSVKRALHESWRRMLYFFCAALKEHDLQLTMALFMTARLPSRPLEKEQLWKEALESLRTTTEADCEPIKLQSIFRKHRIRIITI